MQADGEHDILMIAGDGEHGAAGICYGAALGGGRVLNATSSQGLLYAIEQLPVQAGTRVPMVLNIAARTVSGPLDIRGDHSDIYYALNTGWMLCRSAGGVRLEFRRRSIGEHAVVAAGDGGDGFTAPEAPHRGRRRRRRARVLGKVYYPRSTSRIPRPSGRT
jgi:pyruvate ferredoxin oxidoreductase alpha subunit